MKKSLLIIVLLPLVMNSCKEKKNSGAEKNALTNKTTHSSEKVKDNLDLKNQKDLSTVLIDTIRIVNDSILIPEFAVQMGLSSKAKKKLSKDKESVIVQAYFYGIPKDTLNEEYKKWGKIRIGEYKVELWNSKTAFFKNIKLPKQVFEDLSDTNFEVLINVFSGRHSITFNLLDCGIIQENIDLLKGKTHLIKGKLLFGE